MKSITPVHDHKTGEQFPPHMVKVGQQTEHNAMIRHQLFKRVPIAKARGKKVRCQWLDEMIHSLALLLSRVSKSSSSRELRRFRTCEDNTHVCLHCMILACTAARGRTDCDASCGEEKAGHIVANETSNIASLPATLKECNVSLQARIQLLRVRLHTLTTTNFFSTSSRRSRSLGSPFAMMSLPWIAATEWSPPPESD